MNRAWDLTTAATFLASKNDGRKFVSSVRRFASVISVGNDLAQSKDSIDTFRQMAEGGEVNALRALLLHAVVIYCRASHSSAIDRYNVGVTGAYTGEQKKIHERITKLRDKVLVHFGPGDGWHDERAIYVESVGRNGVTHVQRRTNTDNSIIEDLDNLLSVAIPYVKRKESERAAELDDVFQQEPELFKTLLNFPFDVEAFFRSVPDGSSRFWGEHAFTENVTINERRE